LEESLFYYLGLVPLLGVISQLIAWRLKVPSILLLLICGVLLGQFVNIDAILEHTAESNGKNAAAHLLFPLISLSVAVILFEGGLSLRLSELQEAGRPVFRLVTLGVVVSWILTTFVVWQLLGMDLRLAILLGAILVVTGPTVVAPLLRNIRPVPKIASMLKWEGIVVDPIGAVLAVLVFEEVLVSTGQEYQILSAITTLVTTMSVGIVVGLITAAIVTALLYYYLIPDYLHGVLILSTALATFAISNAIRHESGLITVTLLGIFLANQKAVAISHIVEFKEHLGVFLISCLFVVLGSRLDLQSIYALGWNGFFFILLMLFVIRPLSVLISLMWTETTLKERIFLGFLAPRGIVAAAVTSVFALKVLTSSATDPNLSVLAEQAEQLVPITFLVIIGTVGFYGLTAAPLARYLGLSDADPQGLLIAGGEVWVRDLALVLNKNGVPVILVDTNYRNVTAAKMSGLRAHCASVLSDNVHEEADLNGIGKLLAMTANDEVNLLACQEYTHYFGRSSVYQLPLNPKSIGNRSKDLVHLPGRILFDGKISFRTMEQILAEGYEIKATTLSDEFTFDEFKERYGVNSRLLFVIDANKRLQVVTTDWAKVPSAKQTIIALVPKSSQESS